MAQEQNFDFDDLKIRRENVNGSFYFYGYKKLSSGKLFKTYIGKDLSKLTRMQKIHQIGKKRKLSNPINYIFQLISRKGLDFTNDMILDTEINRELCRIYEKIEK